MGSEEVDKKQGGAKEGLIEDFSPLKIHKLFQK